MTLKIKMMNYIGNKYTQLIKKKGKKRKRNTKVIYYLRCHGGSVEGL